MISVYLMRWILILCLPSPPADANRLVGFAVSTVYRSKGGRGVVREAVEDLLLNRRNLQTLLGDKRGCQL